MPAGTTDPATAEFWGPLLDQAETGSPQEFPNNGWVVHALQTAWWAITHTDERDARQLQDALELAVRADGDTDTTAAIAGGLLGARWGASALPARWRRALHGWPGLFAKDLVTLAALTANGGRDDLQGWPSTGRIAYEKQWTTSAPAVAHPHDGGLFLGGYDAAFTGHYDAVVSLCRMGTDELGAEHLEFWLIDGGPQRNPNLAFLLDDAARTVQALRAERKTVLLHCVEGRSRTPSVAARYSLLLGEDPKAVLTSMDWRPPTPNSGTPHSRRSRLPPPDAGVRRRTRRNEVVWTGRGQLLIVTGKHACCLVCGSGREDHGGHGSAGGDGPMARPHQR